MIEDEGFAPVIGEGCRMLVPGTFPGPQSRASRHYYESRNNVFWSMAQRLWNSPARSRPYEERCQALRDAGVGLWDVIARCRLRYPGAYRDEDLLDRVYTDLPGLIARTPTLRVLAFNGQEAMLWAHHQHGALGVDADWFPSTSGRRRGLDFDEKVNLWRKKLARFGVITR